MLSPLAVSVRDVNDHQFLDRLSRGDLRNVRFTELCRLAKALGFEQRRDGGYIADIPDLEACSAFGETPSRRLLRRRRHRAHPHRQHPRALEAELTFHRAALNRRS